MKLQTFETIRTVASLPAAWPSVQEFKSKGRVIEHNGNNYVIVDKKQRLLFSQSERIKRVIIGLLAAIVSCGFALLSKNIRDFFVKKGVFSHIAVRALDQSSGVIPFYHHNDLATEFMGNFYPCEVVFRDIKFACAEAAFQGAKYSYKPEWMREFANLDGQGAFEKSQLREHLLRDDWDTMCGDGEPWKVRIMRDILYDKFTRNPELMVLLKSTGNAYLIEHNTRTGKDTFWSDNYDGTGQNILGKLLMQLRDDPEHFLSASTCIAMRPFTRMAQEIDNFYSRLGL